MWGHSSHPTSALFCAHWWHEPGLSLKLEIPGAGIQAVVDDGSSDVEKCARQENCLGSALEFFHCSSNTSACQKATPSWPGTCILLPNPPPFPSPLYLTNRNAFVLTQDRLLLSVSPDSAPVGHSRAHSLTPLYCSLHTALTNPLVLPSCLLPRAVLQYPSQSR